MSWNPISVSDYFSQIQLPINFSNFILPKSMWAKEFELTLILARIGHIVFANGFAEVRKFDDISRSLKWGALMKFMASIVKILFPWICKTLKRL